MLGLCNRPGGMQPKMSVATAHLAIQLGPAVGRIVSNTSGTMLQNNGRDSTPVVTMQVLDDTRVQPRHYKYAIDIAASAMNQADPGERVCDTLLCTAVNTQQSNQGLLPCDTSADCLPSPAAWCPQLMVDPGQDMSIRRSATRVGACMATETAVLQTLTLEI
jgi:hypothetical protein